MRQNTHNPIYITKCIKIDELHRIIEARGSIYVPKQPHDGSGHSILQHRNGPLRILADKIVIVVPFPAREEETKVQIWDNDSVVREVTLAPLSAVAVFGSVSHRIIPDSR